MTPTLLPAIDQLRLVAEGMDVIPNRVVHVQTNPLTSQFRVRVVDDFETGYATVVSEALVTDNDVAKDAVVAALQIRFGAQRVIENGTFHPGKTIFRYTNGGGSHV